MKILVTGANGFLGQHLTIYLAGKGYHIAACSRGICRITTPCLFEYYAIDLTDERSVLSLIGKVQPDVVIHTAAMSKPDECNTHKTACLLQNVETVKFLLQACKPLQTHFIYISTDFIFGENGPHSEDEVPAPMNFYGESKLLAENLVVSSGLRYAIVRPVFIYGPVLEGMRPSFLHWIKNNLEQHKFIKVVSDQQRTPTLVTDICKGIEVIVTQKQEGAFHLAGKDIISPFQMAVAVASFLKLDAALIENVTSDTFIETVQRAKHSGLKIDKARKILGYEPVSFEEGVQLTFN
ncbi:MAG TPA: SDR family oxidoreductase [Panacibacter sp.]|nr:SDR family oxidoreductase [Panacibacter sp.]